MVWRYLIALALLIVGAGATFGGLAAAGSLHLSTQTAVRTVYVPPTPMTKTSTAPVTAPPATAPTTAFPDPPTSTVVSSPVTVPQGPDPQQVEIDEADVGSDVTAVNEALSQLQQDEQTAADHQQWCNNPQDSPDGNIGAISCSLQEEIDQQAVAQDTQALTEAQSRLSADQQALANLTG